MVYFPLCFYEDYSNQNQIPQLRLEHLSFLCKCMYFTINHKLENLDSKKCYFTAQYNTDVHKQCERIDFTKKLEAVVAIYNQIIYVIWTITLRENRQDISSEDRQELQPSTMRVQSLKKNFICWLKSMSQVSLYTIEWRKQAFLHNITLFSCIS